MVDGVSLSQPADMGDEQVRFELVGMVEVLSTALFIGEMGKIAVVVVEMKVGSFKLTRQLFR
jgi:hypothetical protein